MHRARSLLQRTKHYAVEQRARSWWHLSSTLAVIAALATTIAFTTCLPLRIAAAVVLGLVLVRLFIVYHDVQHGTILKDSRLARLLMHGYGLLVLNPPSIWSRSHDHHHRTVGQTYGSSIGSFPLMTRAGWLGASRPRRLGYLLQRHPLTIALGYVTIFLFGMCVRSFAVDRRRHLDSGLALALHAALVTLLAVFAPALLLFLVLVPMTVACALGAYLFYAQHNYPDARVMARGEWTYVAAALDSSSYIRMGPLMRWFTGNIGFHHVHHLNARIPFYRLPEAMAGLPELQRPGTTSLSPRQVWKCLRLRLWDPAAGRMVRR
jgi:omega-6 fatty acid desaturase (delta-12 desaturase)